MLICISNLYPQISTEWINTYNYPVYGIRLLGGSTIDNQGNVYMNGSSMNYYNPTLKFSSNGTTNWVKISEEIGSGITAGNDGFLYAISIRSLMALTKYTSTGDTIWSRGFSGNLPGWNYPYFVTTNSQGHIFTISVTKDTNSPSNITIIKYDNNGNQLWTNYFRTPNQYDSYIFPNSYVFDQNNNLYVTGTLPNNGGGLCFFITKITSSGTTEWINFDYNAMSGTDVALDNFGNVYCTGWSVGFSGSHSYYFTKAYKYSPSGTLVWDRDYVNDPNNDGTFGSRIKVDNQNNLCILAVEQKHNTLKNPIHILKYDALGNLYLDKITFYLRRTNGVAEKTTNLILDEYNNIYINGYGSRTINDNERGLVTAKYDTTGSLVWITNITNTSFEDDEIGDLFVKGHNIYTTGTSYKNYPNSGRELLAAKYYQTSIGILQQYSEIPENYKLEQNYPNPFNPSTKIKFSIPKGSFTSLKVYDVTGKEIKELLNEFIPAGTFEIEFSPESIPSGVYFYKLTSNKFESVKKMIIIK